MKKIFFSELISTFCLIFFSCGSMVYFELNPSSYAGIIISLTFMMSISSMVFFLGPISGAHMNPAVSLVMRLNKNISWPEFIYYSIAQVLGAGIAGLAHIFIWGSSHDFGATRIQTSLVNGSGLEFLMSFILMLVIIIGSNLNEKKRLSHFFLSFLIGATVGLCAYFGGPYTNASMNPVRSLIPMLFTFDLSHWWVYLSIPCLAMIMANKIISPFIKK